VNRFVFYAFKFLSALLQLYAWQFLARSLRNRRLSKDYERKVQSSETFMEVAMIRLILKRLERGV